MLSTYLASRPVSMCNVANERKGVCRTMQMKLPDLFCILSALLALSVCCFVEMGSIHLRKSYFHGFLYSESPVMLNETRVVGTPAVFLVTFPACYDAEFVWCVTMGGSFCRNKRGRVAVCEKRLAFAAFCIDMQFVLGTGEIPHKYQTPDLLWRALVRVLESKEIKGSIVQQILSDVVVAPDAICDLWSAPVVECCIQCAPFLADCDIGDAGNALDCSSADPLWSTIEADEQFLDASDDELPDLFEQIDGLSKSEAEDEPALFMEDDCSPASPATANLSAEADDAFNLSAKDEYDGYNMDEESRRVMKEIDSEVDDNKRV